MKSIADIINEASSDIIIPNTVSKYFQISLKDEFGDSKFSKFLYKYFSDTVCEIIHIDYKTPKRDDIYDAYVKIVALLNKLKLEDSLNLERSIVDVYKVDDNNYIAYKHPNANYGTKIYQLFFDKNLKNIKTDQ